MDKIEQDLEAILTVNAPKKFITKSRLLQFIQCERLGYIAHTDSKSIPAPSLSSLRTMRQGTEVGLEAQKLYPEGVLVKSPAYRMAEALIETEGLLKTNKTLFEATFEFDGVIARVDILKQTPDGLEIIEVKSGTDVSEEYINDITIQFHILSNLGFKISKAFILNINSKKYDGVNLFKFNDMSCEIGANLEFIKESIEAYKEVIKSKTIPNTDIGYHCQDPHDCPFFEDCKKRKSIPEISILDIPNNRNKWKQYNEGKINLIDVLDKKWSVTQERMIKAHLEKKTIINENSILSFLFHAKFPLHHLDFETEQRAIPRLVGTRPYQQVVFQYSLHKEEYNGDLTWTDYLVTDENDHRLLIVKKMLTELGTDGSIVSYNATFEKSRIKELAEDYPEYKEQLLALIDRFIDPLEVFREAIYHPSFEGSFSIKKVAPAILGESASYTNLEVQDGIMAQDYFDKILAEKDEVKKQGLIIGLREYCKQDTFLMVLLVRWLREQVKESQLLSVSNG